MGLNQGFYHQADYVLSLSPQTFWGIAEQTYSAQNCPWTNADHKATGTCSQLNGLRTNMTHHVVGQREMGGHRPAPSFLHELNAVEGLEPVGGEAIHFCQFWVQMLCPLSQLSQKMQLGVKFTPRLMLVRYMECGKFGWISESLSWDGLVDS